MSRHRGSLFTFQTLLLLGGLAGCDNQLPTFAGGDRFPDGVIPPTIEHIFESTAFLQGAQAVTGPTTKRDVEFDLLARDFDGLNARVLAAFDMPDTVVVDGVNNETFEYADSNRVFFTIPDSLSATKTFLQFDLYTIEEAWDTATVGWTNAVNQPGNQVAWSTPGGMANTNLVGITAWTRDEDGSVGDTIAWENIPGSVMNRLATGEAHGLMVVLRDIDDQVLISDLTLEASFTAESHPDTVVVAPVPNVYQTFIYSQEAAVPNDVLRVGGITSDRSMLRIRLDNLLPGCANPVEGCELLDPEEVSINRVELLLDPQPVSNGYRPVAPLRLSVWRTAEPDLGPRAPLASVIDVRLFPGSRFTPDGLQVMSVDLTTAVAAALARGDTELGVALLIEPEASTFAYGWFDMTPRLRFVYTTPPTPRLP